MKKLFTHSLLYGLGPQIPKFAGFFVLPLITPFLTNLDYGIYGVITAYAGLLSMLGELGISVVLVNTFYEYNTNDKWIFHWKRLLGFLVVWSVIYGVMLVTFINLILPNEAMENRWKILIVLFIQSSLFNSINVVGGRFFQLNEKPGYILVATAISGIVTVVSNFYFIAILKLGYMGWYYSSFIGAFSFFLFYSIPLLFKYKLLPSFQFNLRYLKRIFKVSLPTIPHNYAKYLLNSSDRVVMERLNISIPSLGAYNVGYSFGSYFSLIGMAVGMAQGPIMARLWFKNTLEARIEIRNIIFILQIIFLTAGFTLALWSKEILPILYRNKDFEESYVFAIVVIMSYMYYPMYWASINKLFYSKQTLQLWKISFIAGVSNVILNLIFIPIFGVMAAAVTTFVSLSYMGYSGFFLKSYKKLKDVNYYPMAWLLLSLGCLIIVYFLKDINVQNKILLSGLLIFISLSFVLKQIKKINLSSHIL
ncbi:lipopolysaccharide biosynthesis protein [Gelidibacter japonicus]|uniref:lipopolysaccharide biosynthesis protein n=1 Tax=Gelidibacter japonicus TaxID=1962232 RepID=UPI003A8D69E4